MSEVHPSLVTPVDQARARQALQYLQNGASLSKRKRSGPDASSHLDRLKEYLSSRVCDPDATVVTPQNARQLFDAVSFACYRIPDESTRENVLRLTMPELTPFLSMGQPEAWPSGVSVGPPSSSLGLPGLQLLSLSKRPRFSEDLSKDKLARSILNHLNAFARQPNVTTLLSVTKRLHQGRLHLHRPPARPSSHR